MHARAPTRQGRPTCTALHRLARESLCSAPCALIQREWEEEEEEEEEEAEANSCGDGLEETS